MSQIPPFDLDRFDAIAIASSTGGPGLIDQIMSNLPADLPVPIFLAQHMPPKFTESFSARLALNSPLTVLHAEDQMPVLPGTLYVGRGHNHLRVRQTRAGRVQLEVNEQPEKLVFKPSADELFRSCAAIYGNLLLAVVMTGIGRDGAEGLLRLRQGGWHTIAQDEGSCAVFGMPKVAIDLGAVTKVLPLEHIAEVVCRLFDPS